jgi:NADH-quinone oxidoreductase subunit J
MAAVLLAILLFSIFCHHNLLWVLGKFPVINQTAEQLGTVEEIGKVLYTTYLFPFELVSFILLTAIVGAIVLAKKKFE